MINMRQERSVGSSATEASTDCWISSSNDDLTPRAVDHNLPRNDPRNRNTNSDFSSDFRDRSLSLDSIPTPRLSYFCAVEIDNSRNDKKTPQVLSF